MTENLSSIFEAIAFKTLALVDLPERGSNQHEINGSGALRAFFNTETAVSGVMNWHYFSDDMDPVREEGYFKFYDSRARSAARTGRTEWRLYYSGEFLSRAMPGDVLILAKTSGGEVFGLIFKTNSSWLRAAQILFQINEVTPELELFTEEDLGDQQIEFAKRQILDELGIEVSVPVTDDYIELVNRELTSANRSGNIYPSTRRMSWLARSLIEVDFQNADYALVSLLDQEGRLFRAMEDIVVGAKLQEGFASVDEFISYSLGVQNRRKSRMGFAFQNHLEEIFRRNNLRFEAQVITERNNTADFIFPGYAEYHDLNFDASLLVFLGAKSSLKERWRQVLDEADRIANKHLCTLQTGISVPQTNSITANNLTLVVPSSLHSTFTESQQSILWTVNEFINYVRSKQI